MGRPEADIKGGWPPRPPHLRGGAAAPPRKWGGLGGRGCAPPELNAHLNASECLSTRLPPRPLSRDPRNHCQSPSLRVAQPACTNPVREPMGASCAAAFQRDDFVSPTAKASPGPARCANEPSPPSTGTANKLPPPHTRNPSHNRSCSSSNTQPQSQPARQIDKPMPRNPGPANTLAPWVARGRRIRSRSRSRNRHPPRHRPWHAAQRNGPTPPAPPVEMCQYGSSDPSKPVSQVHRQPSDHRLDKQLDDNGSSNAVHADREYKEAPWRLLAPPVRGDACGNDVAQAALSSTPMPTSHSPVQDNGTARPDDRWFVVYWRGSKADSKPMRLPDVDSPTELRCPHGCSLIMSLSHREENTIHVDVRCGSTEPCKFVLQARQPADRKCPGCFKHIAMKLVKGPDDTSSGDEVDVDHEHKHAFMACLWPPHHGSPADRSNSVRKYVHDAVILGFALQKHCFEQRRVLLVTADALVYDEVKFLGHLWELREMDDMKVHKSRLRGCEQRFRGVFNKLQAWQQTEFHKVVLLDLDILVVRNIDELFAFKAPSALPRGNFDSAVGSTRKGDTLFNKKTGRVQGGINAGVIVLEPRQKDFHHMQMQLREEGDATNAPEQDYLSTADILIDKWNKLHAKYNWQPHQLRHLVGRFTDKRSVERNMEISEISVFHFSGAVSPRDFFHGGFGIQWTGEGARDFDTFRSRLVEEQYSKGQVPKEDLKKMHEAVRLWKDMHDQAWPSCIQSAVGTFASCPVCVNGSCDEEHAFWLCPATLQITARWKTLDSVVGSRDLKDTMRQSPKVFRDE